MIESPVLMEVLAERGHKYILRVLEDRFGSIPKELTQSLKALRDDERLEQLVACAASCEDMEAFRQQMTP